MQQSDMLKTPPGPAPELSETDSDAQAPDQTTGEAASDGQARWEAALEAIRRGLEVGQSEGESLEADAFGMMFSTRDMKEGVQAFLEKRKPEFEGR